MNRLLLVSIILLAISCNAPKGTTTTVDKSRPEPNIVMILADDLGWQDVKCYDIDEPSPYETPNIDKLAKEGVLFWQGYSPAPTCAPSRCAIMSGNHAARAQKTHVVGGGPPTPHNKKGARMMDPWYSGRMPENEMTLARVLKQNNYRTGHSGKWHMAINHNAFPQPEDQGFDYSKSEIGISKRIRPHRLAEFATDEASDEYQLDENGFARHATTESAIKFIEQEKANPFFLYYADILTFGLAFLETTANPYILSMGSEETATQRLNLAQAFNPIGALAGLYVAQNFILGSLQSDDVDYGSLSEAAKTTIKSAYLMVIRNPYVILGLAVIGILVLIAVMKMPENKKENTGESVGSAIGRIFKGKKFREGVIAQMFYVGAQIMCWTYIYQYAETLGIDNGSAVPYAMTALVIFLAGRWVCTFALKYFNSGQLLMYMSFGYPRKVGQKY